MHADPILAVLAIVACAAVVAVVIACWPLPYPTKGDAPSNRPKLNPRRLAHGGTVSTTRRNMP